MSDNAPIGLPEAARQLGVSLRTLRQAIRSRHVPAPPHLSATATLSAGWIETAAAAFAETPRARRPAMKQKVPPFARYEGTSAWRKYHTRLRDYARFREAAAQVSPKV